MRRRNIWGRSLAVLGAAALVVAGFQLPGQKVLAEETKTATAISTLQYDVTVAGNSGETSFKWCTTSGYWEQPDGTVSLSGNGDYTINLSYDWGSDCMVNMGYIDTIQGSSMTVTINTITVNGTYVVDIDKTLDAGSGSTNGLYNCWSGLSEGYVPYTGTDSCFMVNSDGNIGFYVISDSSNSNTGDSNTGDSTTTDSSSDSNTSTGSSTATTESTGDSSSAKTETTTVAAVDTVTSNASSDSSASDSSSSDSTAASTTTEATTTEDTNPTFSKVQVYFTVKNADADSITWNAQSNNWETVSQKIALSGDGDYSVTSTYEWDGTQGFKNTGYFDTIKGSSIEITVTKIVIDDKYEMSYLSEDALLLGENYKNGLKNIWSGLEDQEVVAKGDGCALLYDKTADAIVLRVYPTTVVAATGTVTSEGLGDVNSTLWIMLMAGGMAALLGGVLLGRKHV